MDTPTIIVPNIPFRGKISKGAFRGELTCPYIVEGSNPARVCEAKNWRFVERLGLYRIRYRCGTCGRTSQYDYSNNTEHPYQVFGKSKWRQIVEAWKQNKGHASRRVKTP